MTSIDFRQTTLEHLLELRRQIDVEINKKKDAIKNKLREEFTKRAKEEGIEDVNSIFQLPKKRKGPVKGSKFPAKYKDPISGDTWAGVGKRPQWFVKHVEAGKPIEELLINHPD